MRATNANSGIRARHRKTPKAARLGSPPIGINDPNDEEHGGSGDQRSQADFSSHKAQIRVYKCEGEIIYVA